MPAAKIAVTIDPELLKQTDELVSQGIFPNRSKAIQSALQDKIKQYQQERLAIEAAKLKQSQPEEEWLEEEVEAWLEEY